jgi:RNA recognition motif-containing protein
MGKRIYVGNLGYHATDADLRQLFAAHGTVDSAQVVTERDSGQSKGFGFVEMSSGEEALAAIRALNGQQHNGRAITVAEAKPKERRGARVG